MTLSDDVRRRYVDCRPIELAYRPRGWLGERYDSDRWELRATMFPEDAEARCDVILRVRHAYGEDAFEALIQEAEDDLTGRAPRRLVTESELREDVEVCRRNHFCPKCASHDDPAQADLSAQECPISVEEVQRVREARHVMHPLGLVYTMVERLKRRWNAIGCLVDPATTF